MKLSNRQYLAMVLIVAFALSGFLASTTSAKVTAFAITRVGATIGITDLGQINLTPASTKGVAFNGGAPVKKILSATASLDFGATAAGACDSLTIPVTGAADGDTVDLGIPAALATADSYQNFDWFISAAGVVTLKRCNPTNATTALSNPAAATVRATVFQF